MSNKLYSGITFNGVLLGSCCFITVISQLPQLVSMGYTSLISQVMWGALGMLSLIKNKTVKISRKLNFTLIVLMIYFLFALFSSLYNSTIYFTSLFSSFLMSGFILFFANNLAGKLTADDIKLCALSYVLAAIILSMDLLLTTLSFSDIFSVTYVYASKNSAGVIVFTALIIGLVYGLSESRIKNIFCLALVSIFLTVVLLLKTRAMIICIPIVIFILFRETSLKNRIRLPIMVLCLLFFLLLLNENFYDVAINKILFANQGNSLIKASSGRFEQWIMFFKDLEGNALIGDGKTERESLFLTAILQCGVPVGLLIVVYSLWPVWFAIKHFRDHKSKEMLLLLLVSVVYIINSIFEQLAPFGPGARSFFLWLLFGIMLSNRSNMSIESEI